MAFIYWVVLLCIGGYIIYILFWGFILFCSGFFSFIGQCWRTICGWGKKLIPFQPEQSKNIAKPLPDKEQPVKDKAPSNQLPDKSEGHWLSGKCEICGNEFSRANSNKRNYLSLVSYNFYGKKREKLLCRKCCRLLLEDANCSQRKPRDCE